MSQKIYLNGRFVAREDARVSVFDHGFLYGDGVFEGIRAYNGRVFRLREHVERLFSSARCHHAGDPAHARTSSARSILETCRQNEHRERLYPRRGQPRARAIWGIDPRNCRDGATVIVIADKLTMYPQRMYDEGMAVITTSTRPQLAGGAGPEHQVAQLPEQHPGEDRGEPGRGRRRDHAQPATAMWRRRRAIISLLWSGACWLLRPPTSGILEGITRNAVIGLAQQLQIPFAEKVFTQTSVYNCDECFLTGTGAEVIPVIRADERVIGDGRPGSGDAVVIAGFPAPGGLGRCGDRARSEPVYR